MSIKSDLADEFARQLKSAKIRFKREEKLVPGRKFQSDFSIYPKGRSKTPLLTVEVDGGVWRSKNTGRHGAHDGSGKIRDSVKECLLLMEGLGTLRLVKDTINDRSGVKAVKAFLARGGP